jgi:hypothetical protein
VAGLAGCNSDEDGIEPEKPPVAFEGKPEPQYAATWKTQDDRSVYQIAPDGTYKVDTKISVKGRDPFNSHLEGEWKVNGSQMLFRDKNGAVTPYNMESKGNTLTLTLTGAMKNKTVLLKQ